MSKHLKLFFYKHKPDLLSDWHELHIFVFKLTDIGRIWLSEDWHEIFFSCSGRLTGISLTDLDHIKISLKRTDIYSILTGFDWIYLVHINVFIT